jgi:hypothetical protein
MPLLIFRTNGASALLREPVAFGKDQFAKRFRNVEIRRRRSCGLPCGIKSRLGSSFDAVEIYPPDCRAVESLDKAFHWQCKLRDPRFAGFVQNNSAPQPTLQIVLFSRPDVQIDPHSIRANFEFLIATELRRVRLKENFHDVAVPQLVTAAIGIGAGKNGDCAKSCAETNE